MRRAVELSAAARHFSPIVRGRCAKDVFLGLAHLGVCSVALGLCA